MSKWDIDPYNPENWPQTPEIYLEQLYDELKALEIKKLYLLAELSRVREEIENALPNNR